MFKKSGFKITTAALSLLSALVSSTTVLADDKVIATQNGNIVNYTTEGNLEVTHQTGCVGFKGLNNKLTPADMYRGVAQCLQSGDFSNAGELYALAGLYARFDTLRVADRTAHGAITVLTMTVGQSATPQQQKKLMAEINKFLVKGTPELAATCQTVRKIGYPDYFPRYMIKHGLSAFMAEPRNRGLVTNFEAEKAWEQVLDTYLHCPALN